MGSVAAASISGREGRVIEADLFDEVRDQRDRAAGVIGVPDYQYPMLVTFADITDPASVQLLDPANLAASFGPGVRLKAVTLEMTDRSLKALLAWLGRNPESALGSATGNATDVPFDRLVHMGDFLRRPE